MLLALALTIAVLGPRSSLSQWAMPRGLYVIEDGDRLVAANTQLNRIDSIRLIAKEKVEQKVVGAAVAVVITTDRLLAYSALGPGWSPEWRRVKEDIERVEANEFGALVVTSDRLMTFNAGGGLWVQQRR